MFETFGRDIYRRTGRLRSSDKYGTFSDHPNCFLFCAAFGAALDTSGSRRNLVFTTSPIDPIAL